MTEPKLHVYLLGPDKVIAYSAPQAIGLWENTIGEEWDEGYGGEYKYPLVLEDTDNLKIFMKDGKLSLIGEPLELTAAEWCDREGPGFLCSTEY